MNRKSIKIIIPVLLLVLIDQAIKLVIYNNYLHVKFYFINNIIGFEPYINIDYSWINSLGKFGIGLLTHIIFNIIIFVFTIIFYRYINKLYNTNLMTDLAFTFLFSGEICSTIDKIFWGGSLDYILVERFFIFDLKDVYLSAFDVVVVLCLIFNYKGFRKFDEKIFIREFKNYIKVIVSNKQK